MEIIFKGGPLDRLRIKLADSDQQYSKRVAGKRVVYRNSGETDPTGLPIFAFQETPDEVKAEDDADA